jgi:N6-L-threonylcarbamoyladenine synthase
VTVTLAIETSCDDTCTAVVGGAGPDSGGTVIANVVASQLDHDRFGGVVPEIAARAHLTGMQPVIAEALAQSKMTIDDIDRVAVTTGPGLTGALLIGVATAKAIAAARDLPLVAVDHLYGHICANFLEPDPVKPPFLCLIASGGHTFLAAVHGYRLEDVDVLGRTLDDAAGEAIDKAARMLGLGFPGGRALQNLAEGGDPESFVLPTAGRVRGLDFSFAGLKTALLYTIRDLGDAGAADRAADLAASFQRAVVEQLALRVERAINETGLERVVLGGGVAANGPLRARMESTGVPWSAPPITLCTDNAAMIASAAQFTPALSRDDALRAEVYASGAGQLK